MKCPVDGATLLMTERSGVEIDYCPDCRGVWLDRGELDKIVAGAAQLAAEPASRPDPRSDPRPDPRTAPVPLAEPGRAAISRVPHGDDRRDYGDKLDEWRERDEAGNRRRRKGFLEDLFDF